MPFDRLKVFKVLRWVADGNSDQISESAQFSTQEVKCLSGADVVSSKFREPDWDDSSRHMLVLDIDVPAALVPSSTPGHHHLFIQSEMSWDEYVRILDALAAARILEPGYVSASKARGFTAVRLPWVRK